MIHLTKINNEDFVLNSAHIEMIEIIPESKVILTSGKYYIVRESVDEIIDRVIEYNGKIHAMGMKLQ